MAKLPGLGVNKWKLLLSVMVLLLPLVLMPYVRADTITLTSDPACVSRDVGLIDCFARGSDNAMWHTSWSGGVQSVWESLGGGFHSGPSATTWGTNRLDVFALGEDDKLWHIWWDGTVWQPADWEFLGPKTGSTPPFFLSHPGCVSFPGNNPNRIDCFAAGGGGSGGAMFDTAFYSTATGDFYLIPTGSWENLGGGPFKSGPAVTGDPYGARVVCAEGSDTALWCKTYSNAEWSNWETRGGALTSGPACVNSLLAFYFGYIDCFVRGTDNAIWHMVQEASNNGQVSEYSLGGVWNSGPAAISTDRKTYDVFAVKADGVLYRDHWDGSSWSGWQSASMAVGQVLTFTRIALTSTRATATTATSNAVGSSTNLAAATDWAVLSVALDPPDAQAGVSVTFTATMALLSSSVPLPQTVYIECQLDSQSCGAGTITYPGPVGQPSTVHANTPWVATPGTHTLTWSIATASDPNPSNNAMSLSFTVQSPTSQSTSTTTTQLLPTSTTESSAQQVTIVQTETVTQPSTSTSTQPTSQQGVLGLLQQNSLLMIGALGLLAIILAVALIRRGKHGSNSPPNRQAAA